MPPQLLIVQSIEIYEPLDFLSLSPPPLYFLSADKKLEYKPLNNELISIVARQLLRPAMY